MFGLIVRKLFKCSDGDSHYCRIIKDIFGFRPNNIELYKLALIHRSASLSLPDGTTMNNERLEFLGDAILDAVVSDYLFIEYPYADEGFLTQLRSRIVSRSTLNDLCVRIGLAEHIISHPGSYIQKHLYGDAFEAMMGAVYLDKGYDFVNRLLINELFPEYLDIESMTETETDYKSRLIEWCQKNKHSIRFDTRPAKEPALQNSGFRSVVIVEGMQMGYGFGQTKKEAEQHAAFSVSQYASTTLGDNFLEMVDRAADNNSINTGVNSTDSENGSQTVECPHHADELRHNKKSRKEGGSLFVKRNVSRRKSQKTDNTTIKFDKRETETDQN